MRPAFTRRLPAVLSTAALVAALGVGLPAMQASAAAGGATGYASVNGGTTGGAGGQTVRATTAPAIHQALYSQTSSSNPLTLQDQGTINHGNTSKAAGATC